MNSILASLVPTQMKPSSDVKTNGSLGRNAEETLPAEDERTGSESFGQVFAEADSGQTKPARGIKDLPEPTEADPEEMRSAEQAKTSKDQKVQQMASPHAEETLVEPAGKEPSSFNAKWSQNVEGAAIASSATTGGPNTPFRAAPKGDDKAGELSATAGIAVQTNMKTVAEAPEIGTAAQVAAVTAIGAGPKTPAQSTRIAASSESFDQPKQGHRQGKDGETPRQASSQLNQALLPKDRGNTNTKLALATGQQTPDPPQSLPQTPSKSPEVSSKSDNARVQTTLTPTAKDNLANPPLGTGQVTADRDTQVFRRDGRQPQSAKLTAGQTGNPYQPTVPLQHPSPVITVPLIGTKDSQNPAVISTEGDGTPPLRSDAPVSGTSPTLQSHIVRVDTPHAVARQVAEALQHMPARPVEISLNPEELGRVRLSVSHYEASITVNVLTERPETQDLMRRHISTLQAAFQAIGYSDIAFAFAGSGDTSGAGAERSSDGAASDGLDASDAAQPDATLITLSTGTPSGVDIRL